MHNPNANDYIGNSIYYQMRFPLLAHFTGTLLT